MAYISTDRVKEIRTELKALFPTKEGWKLSVTKEHSSTVNVRIMQSPINFGTTEHIELHHNWIEEYSDELKSVYEKIQKVVAKGNYNRNANDPFADYSDFNFFYNISLGKWNQEIVYVEPKSFTKPAKKVEVKEEITSFETGKIYKMGWICDADATTFYKVIKRTAKTVTIQDIRDNAEKTCRISFFRNVEQIKPTGSYSMAPILSADNVESILKREAKKVPASKQKTFMQVSYRAW